MEMPLSQKFPEISIVTVGFHRVIDTLQINYDKMTPFLRPSNKDKIKEKKSLFEYTEI